MHRTVVLSILMLVAFAAPPATASPEHEAEDTFGATPGDPRIIADSGACYNATLSIADTSCAVLYGHIFNLRDKVPINVQRVPDYWTDLAQGFSATVGYEEMWNLNELILWSTPGFVEYSGPDKEPELHEERGITADVAVNTDVPITGYWYLSADYTEHFGNDVSDGDPDPGALPCLTVRMTLQTGRHWGNGDVLAVGESTKTIVSAAAAGAGAEAPLGTMPCPHSDGEIRSPEAVTEFEIVLDPLVEDMVLPAEGSDRGFIVHIEWYQFAPDDPQHKNKVYMTQWNLHTGPEYLNRVVLPVRSSVWIEEVRAVAFDGKLYVQGVANSPWGSYDIDPGSIALRLFDADGKEHPMRHVDAPLLHYSTGHDGHFDPMRATIGWDYEQEALKPGTYTVQMHARNWQHLAEASGTTTIVIKEPGEEPQVQTTEVPPPVIKKDSPGPALVPLLLIAALAVALMRRR